MRIVIDLQGAQTDSRFRGIGRYARSFAEGVVRNRAEHEVILALNDSFPETIEPIRAAFEGLLPQESIRVWSIPQPVRENEPGNCWRREAGELIREAFLAGLRPDVIHVTSLFEGFGDDAVTSIGRFANNVPVSVSLYDLIPLVNPEHYLEPNPLYAQYYHRKIEHLKRASLYLAISEFARQEGLVLLDRLESRVVNVSTAVDPQFRVLNIQPQQAEDLCRRFGLTRPFILYTGGADDRKNLARLVQAFAVLPSSLREGHQLLFAGKFSEVDVRKLRQHEQAYGLKHGELNFTGYISDAELVELYNLCQVFVFPSWHEGFGLPALEAMACGAAVIGAGTSSLPEVIGLEDALFNPLDVASISTKLAEALGDKSFREALRVHGLKRARHFSWDATAQRALAAFESLNRSRQVSRDAAEAQGERKRLAFVSPLPPERTGIADYSAELLPALAEHYDIDLVLAQEGLDGAVANKFGPARDVKWLRDHAPEIDRVLYHVGNSPFHRHMLSLIQEAPGTVVLHDFFLSGLLAWQELIAGDPNGWTQALYAAHGYGAVRDRFANTELAKQAYPVNLHVLQYAQGVIVHSLFSKALAGRWYGTEVGDDWEVIPLLRSPVSDVPKTEARRALGFRANEFIVCSFGFLDPTKCNERLLNAWIDSALSADEHCRLIFVGENHGGAYGEELREKIRERGLVERVQITGFAPSDIFRHYLSAADLAIQLRTQSRGETSAAVLDCMNHGVPLIVNASGSIGELDHEAVWMLPEEFDDRGLTDALETLWRNPQRRRSLGERGRMLVRDKHSPGRCAALYTEAIERFHVRGATSTKALIEAIAALPGGEPHDLQVAARAIAASLPLMRPAKRLLVDISGTCRTDRRTGIERVARGLLLALLEKPPPGFRTEPVYLSKERGEWKYRFARRYTLELLNCPADVLDDEIVDPESGDVLLGVDLSGDLVQAERAGLFSTWRNRGVSIYFVVHDLLPIRMPQRFPPGADRTHYEWLSSVTKLSGAVCVSNAVADELAAWIAENATLEEGRRIFRISWNHSGADVFSSGPTVGLPTGAESTLDRFGLRPTFLMVGTIEPRKGYLQATDAFTELWKEGVDANLVIVGAEGWKDLPDEMRRDIPQTIERLERHPERGHRLFWLDGISDEFLDRVYATSTCLIAASYGEGFGLPVIEAIKHGLPVLARDLPVFREVAGEWAHFFSADQGVDLARVIRGWLNSRGGRGEQDLRQPEWLTWSQSADMLARLLDKWSTPRVSGASPYAVEHPDG